MTATVVKPAIATPGLDVLKELEKRELDQLERENRLNKSVSLKTGDAITERQKKVINALSCEKKNLINNLKLIKSKRTQRLDIEEADKITELFEEGDLFDQQLNTERKYLLDLNTQILKTTNEIYHARRQAVRFSEGKNRTQYSEKIISNLQNKLYAANVKLNKTLKENEKLKEEIHLQLITRQTFNTMYAKMLKRLETGKSIVADVLEKSADTYNKREVIIKKLTALKERDKSDLLKRSSEMQDLQMRYEQDVKIRDFRQAASVTRKMKETETRLKIKEEQEMLKNLKLEEEYNEIFDQITEFAETEDIDIIKREFDKREASIMMLFKYANESNCELDVLSAQTQEQMTNYLELKSKADGLKLKQRERKSHMEGYLNKLQQESKETRDAVDADNKLITKLFNGIDEMFLMCECDPWPLLQLLGENRHVTEFNFLLFCKLIEERIIELLTVYDWPIVDTNLDILLKPTGDRENFKFGKDSKGGLPTTPCLSTACEVCMGNVVKSRAISFDLGNTRLT